MDKKSKSNKANINSALKLSFFTTLVAALLTAITFFLPLASANDEHEEYLKRYAQEFNVEEIEMTNEDAIHISMYDFAKTYWVVYSSIDKTLATVVTAVIGAAGVLSLITLLFTLLKKPVAIFIFNLFTFGAYYLMVWDFKDRGVMPNSHYDWGIAYYLYFIGLFLVFAGAIWMFIKKVKLKKQFKQKDLSIGVSEQ